ncbi:MAG TPA: serine/threonine-protein kinase [Polyangia bacterium]
MGKDEAATRVIAGKYHLIEQVGSGGMAVVWRAEMRGAAGFTRAVAVKELKAELRAGQNYVDMFIEEARVGAELQHPNIVQVFDFCEDDGRYCLVMEWMDGLDLRGFVGAHALDGRAVPWPLVVAIGIGALRGLGAAHERVAKGVMAPIIHRDVSPANILIGRDGAVKLADFGLARARDRMRSLTLPGIVKGKLGYLAPEITHGSPATAATDLFAMGCVLWQALAGKPLFVAPDPVELFRQIRAGDYPSIANLRPDVPPRLAEIVHQALAVEPGRRFPTAKSMTQALAGILAAQPRPIDSHAALAEAVRAAQKRLSARPMPEETASEVVELHSTDMEPPAQ